jgi:uncharacterized protein (TIGR03435 family)
MVQRTRSMNCRLRWTIAPALAAIVLLGSFAIQASQSPPLAFEVVSLKVNKPGERRELAIQYLPGGRFSARGVPIPLLLAEAFDTARLNPGPEFQRKVDVSVIERDLYDIEAIAPKDAIPPGSPAKVRNDKMREMLQTLLKERFKLRVHQETREDSAYAIVTAKNGPMFNSATIEECADRPTNLFDPASCHSMADLVKFATRVGRLDRPVVDKTGLTGLYSMLSVDWAAIITPGAFRREGIEPAQLLSDILARMGLKLDTQKATLDMLVVDYIETPTTEN